MVFFFFQSFTSFVKTVYKNMDFPMKKFRKKYLRSAVDIKKRTNHNAQQAIEEYLNGIIKKAF